MVLTMSRPEDKRCMSFRMMWCVACEFLDLDVGKLNVLGPHAIITCVIFKVINDDIKVCSAEGELS